MKAILVNQPGDADQLELGSYRKPNVKKEHLRVKVEATALNRADILQREGKYPPPKGESPLLGLEVAGTVEKVGAGCEGWKEGDRVFGLLGGGGYAEYANLHHGLAMPMPEGLSFDEAAAIPEVFLTAFQALYWLGNLEMGQDVLVHAGASGVGTAAIQLATAGGARVFTTASQSKLDACRELGAERAIDYRNDDFVQEVLKATHKRGVDLVVDFIGAPYLERNLEALAMDGRIVMLATLGGAKLESFSLRSLFAKRAQVMASTLRNRDLAYKTLLTSEFASFALPLFEEGRLKPVIDTVYHWKDVADAHRRMEANRNVGKLVLRVQP